MSENTVIKVENLSKQYRRGVVQGHDTLRDAISEGVRSFVGRKLYGRQPSTEYFWALRDIGFEVRPGEVMGIIGRNGAGKSTLLKILSRITVPTEGRATIFGRVGSLLEVGTGFHLELTGRENVYLNGAILGMKKAEIDSKFDEIVEFSEIGKFIDTPVKRYSSGMYVRLAFAVAAHLETEVLIVDEVLAVGDVRFQGKCLDKMRDAKKEGRTILFVSHNMETVARLCERIIVMNEGRIVLDGSPREAVSAYLDLGIETTSRCEWSELDKAPGSKVARLCGLRVKDTAGAFIDSVDIRDPFRVEMEYEVLESGHVLMPNFHFNDETNLHIFSVHDSDPEWRQRPRPKGRFVSAVNIPGNFLSDGTHQVSFALTTLEPEVEDHFLLDDAITFKVLDTGEGESARGGWKGPMHGVVRPLMLWDTEFTRSDEMKVTEVVGERESSHGGI